MRKKSIVWKDNSWNDFRNPGLFLKVHHDFFKYANHVFDNFRQFFIDLWKFPSLNPIDWLLFTAWQSLLYIFLQYFIIKKGEVREYFRVVMLGLQSFPFSVFLIDTECIETSHLPLRLATVMSMRRLLSVVRGDGPVLRHVVLDLGHDVLWAGHRHRDPPQVWYLDLLLELLSPAEVLAGLWLFLLASHPPPSSPRLPH